MSTSKGKFSPSKSKVLEQLQKRKHEEMQNKRYDISYCHYNDAVYMGDMNGDKKHGKGLLFHDDGSIVISNYNNDVQSVQNIIIRENSIASLLYDRSGDLSELVYKISKYIIKIPYSKDNQIVNGKGILIDYQCHKIYELTFKEGQIIHKKEQINAAQNYDAFKDHSIGLVLGEKHQKAFGVDFQRHEAIEVKQEHNVLRIGFVNPNGNWHGLGCKLYVNNYQVSGIKTLFLKAIEVGYYRNEKLQLFGLKHFQNSNKYIGHFQGNIIHGLGLLLSTKDMKWCFGNFSQGQLSTIQSSNNKNYREDDFKLWPAKLKQIHKAFKHIWIDLSIDLPSQLHIYKLFKASLSFRNHSQQYKQDVLSINHELIRRQLFKTSPQNKILIKLEQDNHTSFMQKERKQVVQVDIPINGLSKLDNYKYDYIPECNYFMKDPFQDLFRKQVYNRLRSREKYQKGYNKEKDINKLANKYRTTQNVTSFIPKAQINQKYSIDSLYKYSQTPSQQYNSTWNSTKSKKDNSPYKKESIYETSSSTKPNDSPLKSISPKKSMYDLYKQHMTKGKQQKCLKAGYLQRRRDDDFNFVEYNYPLWQYQKRK